MIVYICILWNSTLANNMPASTFHTGKHTVTLVRNGKSSAWKVKMHAQMFSKGWRAFVRDNRLKLDDICLFELTKDDTKMLTMTVYIIRYVNHC